MTPSSSSSASYAAVALALLIIAPNLYWLEQNNWLALGHASGVHKVDSLAMLGQDGLKILTGIAVLFLIPASYLFRLSRFGARRLVDPARRAVATLAAVLAFGPLALMLLGTIPTDQIVKPLWVLPMTSSMAVGLALLFGPRNLGSKTSERIFAATAATLSGALALAFVAFLLIGEAIGQPAAYFAADAKPLGGAINRMWHSRQNRPLACIAMTEDRFGGSAVLWLPDRPRFVNFFEPYWSKPEQVADCRRTGGIAVLSGADILPSFPNACPATRERFEVKTRWGLSKTTWPVDLVYIAPEGEPCGHD